MATPRRPTHATRTFEALAAELPSRRDVDQRRAEGAFQHFPHAKRFRDFLEAIREGRKAGSGFHDYGGPLTELAMIGIVSMNFPGRKLAWDSAAMRFTDCAEANAYVKPRFRRGWSL